MAPNRTRAAFSGQCSLLLSRREEMTDPRLRAAEGRGVLSPDPLGENATAWECRPERPLRPPKICPRGDCRSTVSHLFLWTKGGLSGSLGFHACSVRFGAPGPLRPMRSAVLCARCWPQGQGSEGRRGRGGASADRPSCPLGLALTRITGTRVMVGMAAPFVTAPNGGPGFLAAGTGLAKKKGRRGESAAEGLGPPRASPPSLPERVPGEQLGGGCRWSEG